MCVRARMCVYVYMYECNLYYVKYYIRIYFCPRAGRHVHTFIINIFIKIPTHPNAACVSLNTLKQSLLLTNTFSNLFSHTHSHTLPLLFSCYCNSHSTSLISYLTYRLMSRVSSL